MYRSLRSLDQYRQRIGQPPVSGLSRTLSRVRDLMNLLYSFGSLGRTICSGYHPDSVSLPHRMPWRN